MNFLRKIFGGSKTKIELPPIDLSKVVSDTHSHILSCIDDGAPDLEQSVNIVKLLVELGFKKLTATPHVMYDFYKNPSGVIKSKLKELEEELERQNVEVEINVGAEYYFDEELFSRLRNDDILSLGTEKYLLFEFSYFNEHSGVEELITEIFTKGYRPLLAHPERYPYLAESLSKYEYLKSLGVLFQLNIMSLSGHYGQGVKHVAEWLIDNNMVEFIGTDIHRIEHMPKIKEALKNEHLHKLVNSGLLKNQFV